MNHLPGDVLVELLSEHEPPCLSLYQTTHRSHPDNAQDVIRYGNLLKEMELSLQQKFRGKDTRAILEPFRALASDADFWNHALDGLAVFGASGRFDVFKLQRPMPELAIVADSFHLKPLLRFYQSADRYQVLVLGQGSVRLFEGNRDVLDEVTLSPDVPQTMKDVPGTASTQAYMNVHGTGAAGSQGTVSIRHGQGSKSDTIDADTEKFFRAVDRAILEHYSKPSGLPLMLAALPQYHALFHKVSQNPFLMQDGIEINADAISEDELRARAWQAVEPDYVADLIQLGEQFHKERANGRSADDLSDVAAAAVHGRVDTLLVEAERHIPGRLETATARIAFDNLAHPEVDDLLDDVAEEVLKKGGNVLVVPKARMPSQTGMAAIYRF